MQEYNRVIIDEPRRETRRRLFWAVLCASVVVGTAGAVAFAREGLTLSHYDARAHLVVARRIVDSLTPGWRQIGAVWLPLPHLLNLLPAQVDWNFRTGYLSAGLSIASLSIGLAALSAVLLRMTGSVAAAASAPAIILLNPNVLYLQSTPMTEPLLFGCSLIALAAVDAWMRSPGRRHVWAAAGAIGALTLCRYEGWAIGAALAGWAAIHRRQAALPLVGAFVGAVAAFLLLGWGATGQWFVASGFFVPDNPARHDILAVLRDVWNTTRALGGNLLAVGALAGTAAALGARRSSNAPMLLALAAAAALPVAAFYEGHPLRVRYMVPLVVAAGALTALAIAECPRRARPWVAAAVCALIVWSRPPLDATAPMVTEAQWETPYRLEREAVSRYLDVRYDGTPILASMGSLAHYMQESAAHGLSLRNFVHEGNGDLWIEAVRSPRRHVRWIAIEQRAEGGDVLAHRMRADPTFLEGFDEVAGGGGISLFRRRD